MCECVFLASFDPFVPSFFLSLALFFRYNTVVCVGHRDGNPILTFTCSEDQHEQPRVPAAPSYLNILLRGLREANVALHDAARYLLCCCVAVLLRCCVVLCCCVVVLCCVLCCVAVLLCCCVAVSHGPLTAGLILMEIQVPGCPLPTR